MQDTFQSMDHLL